MKTFIHLPTIKTNAEVISGSATDEDIIAEFIKRTRFRLIIHSIIYYHFNDNILGDHQWDALALELVKAQQNYPEISERVGFHDDVFKTWTGDTGMHLVDLPYHSVADRVLRSHIALEQVRSTL